jgi:alpha-mannosidase
VTKGSAAGPSKLDDKVLTQAGLGTPVAVDDLTLENGLVKYRFDASGQLVEALDKTSGRAILAGPGNALSLYIDRPYGWDAWDIDFDYVDQQVDSARGDGPVRSIKGCLSGSLIFTLKIGESQIRQTVSLASNSTRLDFDTAVEWRELHKLLRVSFPAAVQATEATFGIQYGYIRRPTHTNTSWDMARFEGAAQRYADISTQDKGLALLSDCKYGYNARENVLGLSLLRAPTTPDPDADLGSHRFTYSIFPHQGGFVESEVLREAAMLDTPPLAIHGMDGSQRDFPFAVEGEGVSLEVVKKAEKEDVYIFRLLETRGRNASCTLSVPKGKLELARTDIMERNVKGQPAVGTRHTLSLEPFQILTLRGILR